MENSTDERWSEEENSAGIDTSFTYKRKVEHWSVYAFEGLNGSQFIKMLPLLFSLNQPVLDKALVKAIYKCLKEIESNPNLQLTKPQQQALRQLFKVAEDAVDFVDVGRITSFIPYIGVLTICPENG